MSIGDNTAEIIIALGVSVTAVQLIVFIDPTQTPYGSIIPDEAAYFIIVFPLTFILALTVIKLFKAGKSKSWKNILLTSLTYILAGGLIFLSSYYVGWMAGIVTLLICLLVRYFAKGDIKQ